MLTAFIGRVPRHAVLMLSAGLACLAVATACIQLPSTAPEALAGDGDVERAALSRDMLLGQREPPAQPVDDTEGFAIPANAAEPTESFEGVLTLTDLPASGAFSQISDIFRIIPEGDSSWKHLPAFSYQFVQSGSHLIPATPGLTITGSPSWNYIIGPGRVWMEQGDGGYMRASLPFALVQRNQNCTHNGAMTFLFSKTRTPRVSNVYYQITQETCYPMKFDLWGMAPASYAPEEVEASASLKEQRLTEIRRRLPTKPIVVLAADAQGSSFDPATIVRSYRRPGEITTYGVVFKGVNYASGCPTRSGEYAFCEDMPAPSYSIAKSAFAGVALMRLGQLFGSDVYSKRIADHIPQRLVRGDWSGTTFNNASDMATGNYNLPGYEADEDSPVNDTFLIEEAHEAKLRDAFAFSKVSEPSGTRWVYQSAATYILTQAMNDFLKQRRGAQADIFHLVRDDVFKPLHLSAGAMTIIRTDNSETGAPTGYYGLFLTRDDIAKLGGFLNNGDGAINGAQVLDPARLKEALFRSATPETAGVPVLGERAASALGQAKTGSGGIAEPNSRRYANGFWGRHLTRQEFPEHRCDFWVSLMTGYGGNIVALLPNGATFYVFSDGGEFPWADAVSEISKLAPMCPA